MKITMTLALTMSVLLPLRVHAQVIQKPQPYTFTAMVSNVRLNSVLIAQGKKEADKVSVTVPSLIFSLPLQIEDVRKAQVNPIPEVNTLIQYSIANIGGSLQEILLFWSPKERPEKSKLMQQPEIFQANRDYIRKNPGLSVIGLVYQAGTTSVLLKRGTGVAGVTFVKLDGQLMLTDNPSSDLELAIIEASFIIE